MKSKKISVMDKVDLTVLILSFAVFVLIDITKIELLLFGNLFNDFFINSILFAISVIVTICNMICKMKGRNLDKGQKNVFAIFCIMGAVGVAMNVFICYGNTKNTLDMERIVLSDGKMILFSEYIDYMAGTTPELTYMNVYQINGVIAKKLGKIDESPFSNKCLLQDKYTYEYDEANKKLTVICEHGSASLEEQNGTGFWSGEFTLE